jgi:putative ABC transport system permease protein
MAPPARRGPYFLTGVARMKEGMTVRAATAGLNASIYQTLSPALGGARPSAGKPIQFYVRTLREATVGKFRTSLLVLLGAVTLVLLIACVNVANLLLGRSAACEREIVLRISLGASTRNLLRQFLTESLVIAGLGAALGVAIAFAALEWYKSVGPDFVPQFGAVDLDSRVLLFTAASVLGSGLLFGLAPALRATRLQMSEALRSARNTTSGRERERARTLLILSEVAFACTLVMGAGLLIRSYVRLSKVEAGTRADHLMTFLLSLPLRGYPAPAAVEQFYERMLERIRRIPGVEAAGAGSGLPPDQLNFSDEYTFEERPLAPREPVPVAPVVIVTPDYFRAVGLPILPGRSFTERDTAEGAPVAIISRAMAQRYFPGGNPVGKKMRQGGPDRPNPWMEIVGIAADAKYTGLDADQPAYYEPEAQNQMSDMYVAVRTGVAPESIVPALRLAVASLDKDLPLDRVQTMQQNLAESVARPRVQTALLAMLAGLGLGLAGIGVYGVVAYAVARRTSELGIRAALGATRRDLLWLIIRQGMKPVLAGLAFGVAGALGVGQGARSLLYGIAPQDPLTLAIGLAVLGVVGLLACLLPALQATRIDPAATLRSE